MSKSCIHCGKPLFEKRGDARFCSLSCKNKYSYKGRLGEIVKEFKDCPKPKDLPPEKPLESTLSGITQKSGENQNPLKTPPRNIDAEFFNDLINEKVFHVENKLEQTGQSLSADDVNSPDSERQDDPLPEHIIEADNKQETSANPGELKNTLPEQYIPKEVKVENQFYVSQQSQLTRLERRKQSIEKEYQTLTNNLKAQQSRDGNSLLWAGAIGGAFIALRSKDSDDLYIPAHLQKNRKLKKYTKPQEPSKLESFFKGLLLVAVGTGIGYTAKEVSKSWREKDRQTKITAIQNRMTQLSQEYRGLKAGAEHIQKTLSGTNPHTIQTIRVLNPDYTKAMYGLASSESDIPSRNPKPLPKNNPQSPPVTFKSDRIIKATELGKLEYKGLHFKGLWWEFFGSPSLNFRILIHGNSGEGKSTFCLWFARYLAENFGRVLYVSAEEGLNKTFHDKLKSCEAEVDNLYILDAGTGDELLEEVGTNEFHFIILDSLHDMEIDARKLKLIFERYANTAFVCIDQNNKKGDLLGANEKKHIVDVVVNVKNYTAETTKNRFKVKGMVFKTADFTANSKVHKDQKKGGTDPNRGYDLDSDRRGII